MALKKNLLLLSHEASNTGAPILFLNLARLIAERNDFALRILCIKGGPLSSAFARCGVTSVLRPSTYRSEESALERAANRVVFGTRIASGLRDWLWADVVLSNTVFNGKLIALYTRFAKRPVVSYVHELVKTLESPAIWAEAKPTFQHSTLLASPSSFNIKALSDALDIEAKRFHALRYHIPMPVSDMAFVSSRPAARLQLCSQHGLSPESLLVLGMGTVNRRKGVDYFLQTAAALQDRHCHFFWIGMPTDPDFFEQVMLEARNQGIHNFHYLGSKDPSLENYLPFDVLFLSSREDPYPLVVLEAAATGMPTVCFRDGGGIVDFVGDDCGWLVQPTAASAAAKVIGDLSQAQLAIKGAAASRKVRAWHLDGESIYATLRHILSVASS